MELLADRDPEEARKKVMGKLLALDDALKPALCRGARVE
jgi:hypothetical protein